MNRYGFNLQSVLRVVAWTVAYFLACRVGLVLSSIGGVVAVVWPASGVGFAAVWLLGPVGLIPVVVGDAASGMFQGVGATPILILAFANGAAAWVGAWLTRRLISGEDFLGTARNVFAFGLAVAGVASAVSGSLGVVVLGMIEAVDTAEAGSAFLTWVLGDAAGALLAAPLAVVWLRRPRERSMRSNPGAVVGFFLTALVLGGWVFTQDYSAVGGVHAGAFLFLPLLVLAGLTLGRRGLVTLVAATALVTYGGTALGRGPFAQYEMADSLFLLQLFLVTVAWSTLLVHGLASELHRVQLGLRGEVEERTRELRQANERLRNEIAEREVAEEARRDLEGRLARAEKMEMIGTLAGGVAHDLNNILTGLLGYPELLLLRLPEDSPLRRQVEVIQRSGQQAAAIVQDLLTLARRGVSEDRVLSINTVIEAYAVSAVHRDLMDRHLDVEFSLRLAPNLLHVKGSRAHLEKAVTNLVSNAVEACGTSGHVVVSTSNVALESALDAWEEVPPGDYVVLQVADDGIGMSDDEARRVFEPFYSKKTLGRSGTGLGMAVVWGTVKDQGGYVDVETARGRGSTVTVYLPATREPVTDSDQLNLGDLAGDEVVLVVDDVEMQREVAREILSPLGYAVETAASGEEAVDLLAGGLAPDVVLLDMIMDPGMDGLETYRRLLQLRPGLPVVIASGYSETERVRDALALGPGRYLKKPYTVTGLAESIRMTLDQAGTRNP